MEFVRTFSSEKVLKPRGSDRSAERDLLADTKKSPLEETRGEIGFGVTPVLAEKEGFEPSRRFPDLLP